MPDLSNAKDTHIIWKDELCASCKVVDSCALIQTMHDYNIFTYSGMHVASCKHYDPDTSSPFYVNPEEGFTAKVQELNAEALEQEISIQLEEVKKSLEGMGYVVSRGYRRSDTVL
jgi:hypothetical protein